MRTDGFFQSEDGNLYRDTKGLPLVRKDYARSFQTIDTGAQLRATLRAGRFTSLGGYPLYFITSDGAALSFESARENLSQVIRSIRDKSDDGWRIVACDINYEDNELMCDHSGEPIPSAYGE